MNNYSSFAYVYDQLMSDAPYEEWIDFTNAIIEKYGINPKEIIDIGCGTGNLSIPLSKLGYEMIGVDLSNEMLAIAKEKMILNNVSFLLIEQDMLELDLDITAKLIISYCDSLNYLSGIEEIKTAFTKIHKHLGMGGYFIFDLHSAYKLTDIYNGQTYAWNDEDVSIIWLTDVNVTELTVEHDLTFFIKKEDGSYAKFQEIHNQRTYQVDVIKELLEETGFELLDVYGDFEQEPVTETTERIFYVARKKRGDGSS
ncbi:MAG: class I SAM-dependent methyltransferase [Vulcanibacillus sp.]